MDEAELDELLRRARARDPEALTRLVEFYGARVFGLLYRLTGTRDAAEDLMQETFLRVVRALGQYEHVGRFEAWLFRIAANLARDRARAQRRHGDGTPVGDWDVDEARVAGRQAAIPAGPEQRLVDREQGERLARAVDRLSDADREIILLRHYSELSFREIADVLGVPLGTALARAHRALGRLRQELVDKD